MSGLRPTSEPIRLGGPPRKPRCTCPLMWMSIYPPPPCPLHGEIHMIEVTF